MQKRKKHILTTLFVAFGFTVFATYPVQQKLVYNGDTIHVLMYWTSETYKPDTIPQKGIIGSLITGDLFDGRQVSCSDYGTDLEVIDNQLYLTGIYSCDYENDSIQADLRSLFKEREHNGKVKMDWFPGTFFFRGGPNYFAYKDRYFYPKEFEFEFGNGGKLLNVKQYDNSKSRISKFREAEATEFINSHIDWNNLPKMERQIAVYLSFSVNEKGKIDSIELMGVRGDSNEIFIQEAIRVIKLIPDWDVLYERGKLHSLRWGMPVVFNEAYRKKYAKDTSFFEEPIVFINGIEFVGNLPDLPSIIPAKSVYSIAYWKDSSAFTLFTILGQHDIAKYAAENGVFIIETRSNNSDRTSQKLPTTEEEIRAFYRRIPLPDEPIYADVDKVPNFPGGEKARLKFLRENIDYPVVAREKGIQGTVYASFVVERDGSVSSIVIIKGIGGGCDEEVVRVMESMPKWTPGEKNGKTVRTRFMMPMNFALGGGKSQTSRK